MPRGNEDGHFFDLAVGEVDARAEQRGRGGARVVAFGGGKGGVGRSVLSVNVGVYLAQLGKRVVLVDADYGGANIHTLLGLEVPGKTLSDVLLRKRESLSEIVLETPVPGLGLLSGAGDITGLVTPRQAERVRFVKMATQLDVDYVVIDLRAGTGIDILDLFLLADVGVVVLSPEPTAVENAYRFIKSAFFRKIWNIEGFKSLRGLLTDAHGSIQEFGFMSPPTFLDEVRRRFPDLAAPLADELRSFCPQIIVNQCRTRRDADMTDHIVRACRRKLQVDIDWLGHVDHDDSVTLSVCKRRPLLLEFPETRTARDIEFITRNLLSLEPGRRAPREHVRRQPADSEGTAIAEGSELAAEAVTEGGDAP